MQRLFIIISIACLPVAAFFLWRRNLDATFVVATLGVVAYFLSYRAKIKAEMQENQETDLEDLQEDES